MWSGLVMSMISGYGTRPPDCVAVPVVPDTCEDVEPPPGQFTCRGRADAGRRTGDDDELLDSR